MRSDERVFIPYEIGTMFMPAAFISSALAPERSINSNLFLRLTDSAKAAFNSSIELNCRSFIMLIDYSRRKDTEFFCILQQIRAFFVLLIVIRTCGLAFVSYQLIIPNASNMRTMPQTVPMMSPVTCQAIDNLRCFVSLLMRRNPLTESSIRIHAETR